MVFLIEYDRSEGKIVLLKEYDDRNQSVAEADRLDLELSLQEIGDSHEVVLLQASSQQALRRTHARYFEDIVDLVRAS